MSSKLGEKILFYRKIKNLTQKELADKVGVSKSFISQVENGRSYPSDDTLAKMSKVLGFDLIVKKEKPPIENIELLYTLIELTKINKIRWLESNEEISNIEVMDVLRSNEKFSYDFLEYMIENDDYIDYYCYGYKGIIDEVNYDYYIANRQIPSEKENEIYYEVFSHQTIDKNSDGDEGIEEDDYILIANNYDIDYKDIVNNLVFEIEKHIGKYENNKQKISISNQLSNLKKLLKDEE